MIGFVWHFFSEINPHADSITTVIPAIQRPGNDTDAVSRCGFERRPDEQRRQRNSRQSGWVGCSGIVDRLSR